MLSSSAFTTVVRRGAQFLGHNNNTTNKRQALAATASLGSVRWLNVHEYISMELFKTYGIKTPDFQVASTPEEAENIFTNLHTKPGSDKPQDVVIKAQVLSGGRGIGRFQHNGFQAGVQVVTTAKEARQLAEEMLGNKLITTQAPQGIVCNKIMLMERLYVRRELFVSIVMDRASQGPMLIASPRGGTNFQEVIQSHPELIFTEPIDIMDGLQDDTCHRMAVHLGLGDVGTPGHDQMVVLLQNMYKMFSSCDCTQIEVNPLAETPDGDIVCLDAKVNFDDNAKYRQSSLFEKRDKTQEDPREVIAADYGLNYVALERGNIGIMVNGAGLAMSTMDIIQLKGGKPANFLDVGGGANEVQVQKAFEILNSDPSVKVILVNIFGGIMRCDVIAIGLMNAAKEIGIQKPIIIRLQGNNVQQAKTLIEGCGFMKMILAGDLEDAAEKAIGVAEIAEQAEKIHVGVKFDGLGL